MSKKVPPGECNATVIIDDFSHLEVTPHKKYYARDSIGNDGELVHRVFIKNSSEYKTSWLLNRFAKKCMNCNTKFGLTIRKHHCRRCGDIFCHKCISFKLPIKGLQESEDGSRVCEQCLLSHPPVDKMGFLSRQNILLKSWNPKFCVLKEVIYIYIYIYI